MKKWSGITLLETMLVLGIVGIIMIISVQQYNLMKKDNDVRSVKSAVDQLFQALSIAYQTNCRANTTPIAITITSLLSNNYLASWNPLPTSIVDTSVGNSGYSVQFNSITANTTSHAPVSIFTTWLGSSGGSINVSLPASSSTTDGTVYIWQSHVAVKLASTISAANYSVYRARLGASCTATTATTTCNPAPAAGPYVIWESLPGFASSSTVTPSGLFMPTVRAFTNLYYNDDMYATSPGISGTWSGNNYQCGG